MIIEKHAIRENILSLLCLQFTCNFLNGKMHVFQINIKNVSNQRSY